jgi:hypothetical protein
MIKKDIFFIADISGFTEFVKSTEKSHSKHIVKELLELIIKSNKLSLTLVEIEGDAIFFYGKRGTVTENALIEQMECMYLKFHDHLKLYESKRICPCGACLGASKLSVKFVSHIGELDFIEINGIKKPYGPDVILVHRLLKNGINSDSYMLASGFLKKALEIRSSQNEDLIWTSLTSNYDNNNVGYSYHELTYLDKHIKMFRKESYSSYGGYRFTKSIMINHAPDKVYEMISNLNFRELWNKDTDEMIFEKDRVNRVGDKHVCVLNSKHIDFKTISSDFGEGKFVYGEVTNSAKPIDELVSFYVISDAPAGSQLEIHYYIVLKGIKKLLYPLVKLKVLSTMNKSISNIFSAFKE